MAFAGESRQHGELLCMRVRLGKAVGMQELVKGGVLQVLELECGERRPGKLAMHVGVLALADRFAGLVLVNRPLGQVWPDLGLRLVN